MKILVLVMSGILSSLGVVLTFTLINTDIVLSLVSLVFTAIVVSIFFRSLFNYDK
jgi:hypothetical protein